MSLLLRGERDTGMWAQGRPPSASQEEALSRNQLWWHLDLGLGASRTVRNQYLLVKAPGLWGCYSSRSQYGHQQRPGLLQTFLQTSSSCPAKAFSSQTHCRSTLHACFFSCINSAVFLRPRFPERLCPHPTHTQSEPRCSKFLLGIAVSTVPEQVCMGELTH